MKKILYTLAAAATLFTACNKDEGTPEASNNVPVQFSTAITRAAGATWGNTDQIGVFMKTAGTPLGTTNLADNVKYANSTNGFTLESPIYYPTGSQAVDFVAYYPYRATPGSDPYIYKVELGNQDSPETFDLLYSNDAQNKTRSTSAVGLTFVHKLSKVVLNIKKSAEVTTLSDLAVKITGMPTKADFALATGAFSNEGTKDDITTNKLTPATANFDATYTAIVIPQAAGATGRKLVFTLGADTYEYAIPNTDNFESVKSHSYNITIKKSGITVSRGAITDWTGTGSIAGDLGEGIPQEITKNGIKMVYIPKGTFLMGSSDGTNINDLAGTGLNTTPAESNRKGNEIQHKVTLTNDFYMSKYEVTNVQYAAFLNAKGVIYETSISNSRISGNGGKCSWGDNLDQIMLLTNSWGITYDGTLNVWKAQSGYDNFPVINVTWCGATEYADWIGGSLPTEAQWEHACRAGTTTPYSYGSSADGAYMWYNSNSDGKIQEVGTKLPNTWGLYDMHGNVLEWCSDWESGFTTDDATDPTGTASGSGRMIRGGHWNNPAYMCRSAYRYGVNPDYTDNCVGFRVVFVP